MDDERIVALYLERSEAAIAETERHYGKYCYAIAYNLLCNAEDANECVNDTYLHAWNSIPPHQPKILATFLGKITRRLAIDRLRTNHAACRGGGEVHSALDELTECIPSGSDVEQEIEAAELGACINRFVMELPLTERRIVICRYWYADSIAAISEQFDFTQNKVKVMLHRTRNRLKNYLEQEGLL